jgi:hypothetical protein
MSKGMAAAEKYFWKNSLAAISMGQAKRQPAAVDQSFNINRLSI